ncbi:hypothetical protein SK128_000536 [Halocaridina rubra]|uniref:Selenocysteine-specific elongation factor n=1 Tax=Halocaridina rubra TaxID=373956 RepID=A0AAN9A6S6_HALRR
MEKKILNFNVGVLGHVDSGKTSLAKALSTVASTACFDKNPQSRERGITIDLGFSSFIVDIPSHLKESGCDKLQFTLVDCPGHASLIRTIIGGAQIIDAMMLVVDVMKGIQTQTAECLVIGEILCDHILVVLNKLDLIPAEKQKISIEKMTKRILLTLQQTKFAGAKVTCVSAKPGGPDSHIVEPIGITDLIEAMKSFSYIPDRNSSGPFLYAVDHCFSIKGQGTVMTGTVLQGSVAVNDNVEIPSLKVTKKVKSIQMFRKPVERASQGDRVGMCVTQFDPKQLERGLVGMPGLIQISFGVIALVKKIAYYKLPIETKSKFHITSGHETVIAKATFFGTEKNLDIKNNFIYDHIYKYQHELLDHSKSLDDDKSELKSLHQFAVLEFERPTQILPSSVLIGSKLDMDVHTNMCRLAFQGKVLEVFTDKNYHMSQLSAVKVCKNKSKDGVVERVLNENEVIVKNLLKKDTNIQLFLGFKVLLSTGEEGMIDGTFGQSGKLKIRISGGLKDTTKTLLEKNFTGGRKKGKANTVQQPSLALKETEGSQFVNVTLSFKKFVFSNDKKMIQA